MIYKSKFTGAEIDSLLSKVKDDVGKSPIVLGDVPNSAKLEGKHDGYSNRALSKTSMAVGAGSIAGLKGWYYSAIDFTNKKITLSDKPTYIKSGSKLLNGAWSSGTPNIKKGDIISLVNNSIYDLCSEVTAISGNVITVNSLPFYALTKDSGAATAVISGKFSDGYSVYIPARPDAGLIDLGGGAFSEGGYSTKATNICAHAEGLGSHAYGQCSHAEGRYTEAGYSAHAEGESTHAKGKYSHAEGKSSHAEGKYSHAEGESTHAKGKDSHAEGCNTQAIGAHSHAEGNDTTAENSCSHVEGYLTQAMGEYSHAEGSHTITKNEAEHACGRYNSSTQSNDSAQATRFSIGIGRYDTNRKNAVEVKKNGDVYIIGVGGYDGTNSDSAQTLQEILANL